MSFENTLLALMRDASYVPLTLEGIAHVLNIDKQGSKLLRKTVYQLLDSGKIAKIKHDRFIIPNDADLVTGIIRFKHSGSALLFLDNKPRSNVEPIHIQAEDTLTALHGDTVMVRLINAKQKPLYYKGQKIAKPIDKNIQFARVIRILKRGYETITGTLKKTTHYYYVIPDDPHMNKDFLVLDPQKSKLSPKPKENQKVVVGSIVWEHRHLNPVGTIMRVLGESHTPEAEFESILHKYKLEIDFPEAVNKEVKSLPTKVQPDETKNRLDCTHFFTLTIDPDDAKDFDDALSLHTLDNGNIEIGIHIADVSAYVRPHSALDKEAHARGNSTYLVGTVIPMLPHALSSGLCSLVEREIRLTKSVFAVFTPEGKLLSTRFANSFIRSEKRLTYKQAYAFLKEDNLATIRQLPTPPAHQTGFAGRALSSLEDEELIKIQTTIRTFWSIASKLRNHRMQSGSLDLDMPEVKIFVNKEGYADRIEQIDNDESHQLIEEFMLLANETVAKHLHEASMPYISRVHDKPDAEKLEELSEVLANHGILVGDLTHKANVTKLLQILKNHPQGYSLKIQFLRSLKQACYRASADGHYGLEKIYYAHFTSPIRRYADLIVHRMIDEYMTKFGHDTALKKIKISYNQAQQEAIAEHITITEQNSTEAERESVKIKLLEYFDIENKKKDKKAFKAIITDVRNHGMFVELCDSMAYGLVHISSLDDDFYVLTPAGNAIEGRRNKRHFKVGDTIYVNVDKVDRYKRQLDFKVSDLGMPIKESPSQPLNKQDFKKQKPFPKKSSQHFLKKLPSKSKSR